MKKRNLLKLFFLGLIGFTSISIATGTVAWILPFVRVDNTSTSTQNISAEILGTYFEYGNGIPAGV